MIRRIRRFLDRARLLSKETGDLAAVVGSRPSIVAYSEDVETWNQLGAYLERFVERGCGTVTYVTSAADDPRFLDPRGMNVRYVRTLVPSLFQKLEAPVLFTTMPDLDRFHVPRPQSSVCCVYAFHSLNSIHEVYRERAFDAFDEFFCTGPHHRRELLAHAREYGVRTPVLHDVGYAKLDRVATAYEAWRQPRAARPVVLLAPSWGSGNLLEVAGEAIVRSLRARDYRVIVRPHPCFFLPVYPSGRAIVEGITATFAADPQVTVEPDIRSEDSFFAADVMISDFSGAAFEFALGTARPALFVDVARKTMNPSWQRLGLSTFEDTMRREVGEVLSVSELPEIASRVAAMLDQAPAWRARLLELRETAVYNFGRSAEVGADVLSGILSRRCA